MSTAIHCRPIRCRGSQFQLRTFVQDLRGFTAKGVFAAYLDLDYTNGNKFEVMVGEIQAFRYFFDKIDASDSSSHFIFEFEGQRTGPVSLFNPSGSPRSAEEMATAIQTALRALPNIGAANVSVRLDQAAQNADAEAGILTRNNFEIRFSNNLAGRDLPMLILDHSNVKLQPNSTFDFNIQEKAPADPNNEQGFIAAFAFSDEFSTGRTATNTPGVFDEVGAAAGLGTPTNVSAPKLLFSVTLRATEAGTVTFTPNGTERLPQHDILVYPKDVVPQNLVSYGNPFTVTIVDNLVANPDSFTVAEDSLATDFNVTANDQLFNGNAFTITAVGATSSGGTATIVGTAPNQRIRYRPAANFFGTETFTYTISNNLGSSTATVTVNVTPVNDPPSVPNKSFSTNLGVPLQLTTAQITAGGTAGPGEDAIQTLSLQSVTSPTANGATVTLVGGNVTYTPTASFAGTDTFVVTVTDNGQTNGVNDFKTTNVTITVSVVNNPPVAVNDLIQDVDEDSTGNILNVLANDSAGAGDNDQLTITAVGPASRGGSVTIGQGGQNLVYSPLPGVIGTETFTYTVRDRGGLTATATVTVELQPTVLPRARNNSATTAEDSPGVTIDVLANDRVNAGSVAILVSIGTPANGAAVRDDNGTPDDLSDDRIIYIPNANFFGTDTFTYVMDDTSTVPDKVPSTGTVVITVTPVNDTPVLQDNTVSATEDTVATIPVTTLLSNDSPGPGEDAVQELSVTAVQAITQGGGSVALVGGNVIYTPAPNFNGNFLFTYTVIDRNKDGSPLPDALTATATVTVQVAAVNDAPVIIAPITATTAEDTPRQIAVADVLTNVRPGPATAVDEVNQSLTIMSVTGASAQGGVVSLAGDGLTITYTPAPDFFGSDTFTFVVRDNGTPPAETVGTVTVTVTPVNDAPIATADTAVAYKGIPLTISGSTLLANDRPGPANESFQKLTIISVTPNADINGTLELLPNGSIVYTPTAGYVGPASFQYTIQDDGQTGTVNDFKTATATVSIDVKEFVPSRIAGVVYVDETGDGKYNPERGERALSGVVVTLHGNAFGQSVHMTQTTLADGRYDFGLLAPGSYTVSFVNPVLMTDGLDTAGNLGDADGVANDNRFGINIAAPGGVEAVGYNFAVRGISGNYGRLLDQMALSYFISNPTLAYHGLYAVISKDNTAQWFSRMEGYDNILYVECVAKADASAVYLTVVDKDHNVYTATLGKGKFIYLYDTDGNMIIRVLGGFSHLSFTKINMATPPIVPATRYLEAVDRIFDEYNW
jgi:large repetitive protein